MIGDDQSWWATAWVVCWSVLALFAFVAGPVIAARIVGALFAPGYDEIAVYTPPAPGCFGCRGSYSREFVSSSGFFEWYLNSSLIIWALFPAIALTIGMTLRTAAARACGLAIALSRRYLSDSWPRTLCLYAIIAVPMAAFAVVVILAPSGTDIPGE